MAERRPRFESRRHRGESPYESMRQSEYVGAFQSINTGLRRASQTDGWSRGYRPTGQAVPIDRTHTDKSTM